MVNTDVNTEIRYFTVSSRDRDTTRYPNVNQYTIYLQTEYKNVHSIELIQAILPDVNDITKEPYLLLNVNELHSQPVIDSNDIAIANSFAMLQISAPVTAGSWMMVDKKLHEQTVLRYQTPKARINKLSISLHKADGSLFDFGTGNDDAIQNTLIFKVSHLLRK